MCAVRRDNFEKVDIPIVNLAERVKDLLDDFQKGLFDSAKRKRDACIEKVETWDQFVQALGQNKMILAPWCDEEVCVKRLVQYVRVLNILVSVSLIY